MSPEIHSIWLMPSAEDGLFLAGLVRDLAHRFGTPVFTPHLTVRGDTNVPLASLAAAIAKAAGEVAAFSEEIAAIETSDAYFRSFYARFEVAASLTRLKQRLDGEATDAFMPHVSLLYGSVPGGPKAAAADEFQRMLAGRPTSFDRLCIVRSGQDIPIAEWAVISSAPLAGRRT